MSGRAKLLLLGVAIVVVIILVLSSTFKVTEYQQAILLQFGEPRKVVNATGTQQPGLYLKTPFVQNVEYFDKRILDFDAPAEEVILGDQKRLVVDTFIRYRITDPLKFYQTVGSEGIARTRLGAILNAATRQVLGTVELITVLSGERGQLMRFILDQVNRQSKDFGVDVIDVRIRRADLPDENSLAVYRRMQTERDREAKEYRAQGDETSQRIRSRADKERTILLANAKRESEILRGQGDAKAVKIFADAFGQDEEFFSFYRSMQAYRQALSSDDTTMVLSPDSEFFRYFGRLYGQGEGALKP
ncbi:MAG: protease modulator HflC [Rhodospirillaceae bacterium]|jgi:modulator of FtsH protease HflC|nr:protease modulator HflC [Rhodospirillaceae bacterium]MBT3627821.1 protease modulator HflC [Rhodospirillaceae bacterium]MBT4426070.1 protease modulator HflC [Rhodospirillaceae bacterium]MBT5676852.1 protease modulator HflC [Rhodospirillaceae bacterium]MBT6827927.1 protease modulator HflC [Rhodospirillaceae bacterium]